MKEEITLHDQIAIAALQGLLANSAIVTSLNHSTIEAIELTVNAIADKFIIDRNERNNNIEIVEHIPIEADYLSNSAKCEKLVLEFFKNDREKADLWFNLCNPLLGDLKPIDMINVGRGKKLLQFIEGQLSQNPPILGDENDK